MVLKVNLVVCGRGKGWNHEGLIRHLQGADNILFFNLGDGYRSFAFKLVLKI